MPLTNRVAIPAEVSNFYDRNLLERAVALFVHTRWAQVRDIPRRAGSSTIKFRRYGNLVAATTPLVEGVTPSGSALSVTDITATAQQYGDYVTVTDVLSYESQDAVLMEAAQILGDQAGDTIDQLVRDVLSAGTNVIFSGTGNLANIDVAAGDVITAANVNAAVAILKLNNARKVTRMINPSTGVSTVPIAASYIGIIHPTVTAVLRTVTGWTDAWKYPTQAGVMDGEVGSVGEVRFVESTNAKKFVGAGTAGVDLYSTVIFGANAYGITRVSGEAMKNIVKPLGSAGSADPLDQRATSGWKATFVAKILNDNFLVRIVSAGV